MHESLKHLLADDFYLAYDVIGNPDTLYRRLRQSSEVLALRDALSSGELRDSHVQQFVDELLQSFQDGVRFPFDLALAAIAVVFELRSTRQGEAYLDKLAAVGRRELLMAPRIARKSIAERNLSKSGTIGGVCVLNANAMPPAGEWMQRPVDKANSDRLGIVEVESQWVPGAA